jgi:glucose-1-phosphate thymidylyltransferase
MAGAGKRMRPHTLTTPKPLIPIAGRSIVERLVRSIADMSPEAFEEVAFVVARHFGTEVEQNLLQIARDIGAQGTIHYQDEALGTAHAIHCAAPALDDRVVIAFADTLFDASFRIDPEQDGIIWVKQVENPSQFGVVKLNEEQVIQEFLEKPREAPTNNAIIGIYYFRDGRALKTALQDLIDRGQTGNGEYQLTDAMENMKQQGTALTIGSVDEWMDCGNKDATIDTNTQILKLKQYEENLISTNIEKENSVIVEPCHIGEGVVLHNSVIGPYTSIGAGSRVEQSVVRESMVFDQAHVASATLNRAMIGNHAVLQGQPATHSIGDYSKLGP